jgi:hypothetical protein
MLPLLSMLSGCFGIGVGELPAPAAPAVVIVHTARQEGELEPCG